MADLKPRGMDLALIRQKIERLERLKKQLVQANIPRAAEKIQMVVERLEQQRKPREF